MQRGGGGGPGGQELMFTQPYHLVKVTLWNIHINKTFWFLINVSFISYLCLYTVFINLRRNCTFWFLLAFSNLRKVACACVLYLLLPSVGLH